MEKIKERFTDYMLRYTADVPADEVPAHQPFDRKCACNPDAEFDEKNGWHALTHKPMPVVAAAAADKGV